MNLQQKIAQMLMQEQRGQAIDPAIMQALMAAPDMPQDPSTVRPYDMANTMGGYEALGRDTGVTPLVGQPPMEYMPQAQPSPGMVPDAGPQAPGTFGGYDDGLRPTPYTADAPQIGGASRERQPVDGKRVMRQDEAAPFELPGFNTTEGQVLGYTMRAADANRILNELEQQGTRFGQRALGILPGNTENMLRDEDFQRYLNAEQNFLAGVLRRDTGAAITSEEFDLYRPMFFPQPGDGPATIEQKRRMRETALAAMAAGTAEGFSLLPPEIRALVQPGAASAPAPARDFSTMSDEELLQALQGGN